MFESLKYILTIASNERRMLYRTAKFWVLAGAGVAFVMFFLVVMTIVSIVDDGIPGEFLLQGTDAYLALYFFSYMQAVLIIFVAGDFRTAEEKARLDQVMLSQPMTTANWVLGKYFGVVSALLYLNVFLLILATIGRFIKFLLAGAGFNVLPFLQYFVIATLPSIFFMTAFVFFLTSLLRLQSIAMVVGLGYVASILFYFHHKFLGLFDYGAFFAPLFSSDFIGFGDVGAVLQQRLFFVLLSFALVAGSVLLYPRLWQSKWSKALSQLSAFVFLSGAALTAFTIIDDNANLKRTRESDLAFQRDWTTQPLFRVAHYDLDIKFADEETPLAVTARLDLANPNDAALKQLVFSLNGELVVSDARWLDGRSIPFAQKHQLLILEVDHAPLMPHSVDSIQISYSGNVDADSFMLNRLAEARGIVKKDNGPWVQGDISAWLSPDFAILPAQCGWYPTPGPVAGFDFTSPRPANFATANIRVEADERLSVITQGAKTDERTGENKKYWLFSVEKPVPGFSLNVGEYSRLARTFKQTDVEVYFHPNHLLDYDLFADVADTCYEAVENILDILEQVSGVPYPYPKLALVEVPLQMQIYTDQYGIDNVIQQPSVVMIDEVTIASKRLKSEFESKIKRARRDGRDDSPARLKRDVFVEIVLEIFMNERLWRGDSSYRVPLRNYVHFQTDVRNPVLDRALELQLYEASERQIRDLFYPDRWNASLSSYDRLRQNEWGGWGVRRRYGLEIDSLIANLTRTPLSTMRPAGDGSLYRASVDFKAPPTLQMLSQRIGEQKYGQAIRTMIERYHAEELSKENFLSTLQAVSGENLDTFFEEWFDRATFPGYRITQARAEKYDTGKMNIVYQVSARIQNGERGDGFVRLVCETKNDKIRRNVKLGSFEEKEVLFPVKEEPKRVKVIPYFSRNRGEILKEISIGNRIRRGSPADTAFTVASVTDSLFFVLDDQDDGFFTPITTEAKYLRPPSKGISWRERTNPFAFGKYYFGWRVKRAGHGDYPARWETKVPKDGEYELSFFYRADKSWYGRNASRDFLINVTDTAGNHAVEFQPQQTADGWYPLGRFSFSHQKAAVIELADVGNGYLVADAVRWEFVE